MIHPILGLHHVTATVNDAQQDLDFCLDLLGMRLVKKTVNFDNHHVYHFYYGTERGAPGTIWTTFPYKDRGVRVGVKGAGQVVTTSFSVPIHSLSVLAGRLQAQGAEVARSTRRSARRHWSQLDPSGLRFELSAATATTASHGPATASARDRSHSWVAQRHDDGARPRTDARPHDRRARLHDRQSRTASRTRRRGRRRHAAGTSSTSSKTRMPRRPINGLGTVHHVAMAIATPDEQLRLRAELLQHGAAGHRGARPLLLPIDLLP